jgi:hypothetical protein
LEWTDEQIEKAKEDFRIFLFMVWRSIGLPQPTPIQYDIANYLQHPPSDRIILEGFRGVAKSFITCAYVVWQLWKNPQLKIMVVSASKDRADANAIFIKRIIFTLPFLSHLIPDSSKGNRDTMNLFDVAPAIPDISPSVKSVGITSQITGSRADILISDDVEVSNNSGTQIQRDKLNEAVKEYDAILKPNGQIIYLGTPQTEESLYNELQNRGYTCTVYPVLYPETKKELDVYGERLAPFIRKKLEDSPFLAGTPIDPLRFNEEEIAKRRLSYGKAGFALQFMLNTSLSDAERFPLKVQDWIVTDLDMEEASLKWSWASGFEQRLKDIPCVALKGDFFYSYLFRSQETSKYTGCVMAIDPSGRGSDELAYAVVKILNGYLFLMEVGGFRDGYGDETLTLLANKCKYWGVNNVVSEANFGDGMWGQLFKPILNNIHPCAYEEVKNYKQKEARMIDVLEPVMARHKLIVNTSVITDDYRVYEKNQQFSLVYQLTRLTREKGALAHDDRIDALAMAVAFWQEVLDRDAQTGMDELMTEQLEKWMDEDWGVTHKEYNPALVPDKYKRKINEYYGLSIINKIM